MIYNNVIILKDVLKNGVLHLSLIKKEETLNQNFEVIIDLKNKKNVDKILENVSYFKKHKTPLNIDIMSDDFITINNKNN